MINQVAKSTILLIFLFCFVPALLSYHDVKSSLDHHDICLVDPAGNPSKKSESYISQELVQELFGVYRVFQGSHYYLTKTSLYTSNSCIFSNFQKCGWPNSSTITNLLSPRGIKLNNDQQQASPPINNQPSVAASIHWDRGHIPLIPGKNQWCLILQTLPNKAGTTQKFAQICTPEVTSIISNSNQEPYFPELPLLPPPDGVWGEHNTAQVHCYIGHWNTRGIHSILIENVEWNPKNIPSTIFILLIQIMTYLMSQMQSTSQESSSDRRRKNGVSHQSVLVDGELWKIYKAAFTHGDFGHLLFNIYSFYIIGACLEVEFGSIPFLNLNILLIFFTSIFTLFISSHSIPVIMNPRNKIVLLGYSPVIFAWSIVMCLERDNYPILPWTTFPNYGSINVIPLIYLGLSVICFPMESSLLSNITGMKMGVLIHMNILYHEFLAPHVLIPMIFLIDLLYFKKYIPLHRSVDEQSYVIVAPEDTLENAPTYSSNKTNTSLSPTQETFLHYLESAMIGISVISIFALDHMMAISQCLVTYLFYLSIRAHLLNLSKKSALMKAYIISVAIFIVTDSMSLGSWMIYKSFVRTESSILLTLEQSFILFIIRWIVNAMGMSIASSISQDNEFKEAPRMLLEQMKKVGNWILNPNILVRMRHEKSVARDVSEEDQIEFTDTAMGIEVSNT